jgi:multidrug resistance efflux pump
MAAQRTIDTKHLTTTVGTGTSTAAIETTHAPEATRAPEATQVSPVPRAATAPAAVAERRFRRSSRVALILIACLALVAALGFGCSYLLYSRNVVSTDNAQVDGDKIDINAPATGTLTDWMVDEGTTVRRNQVVGRVKIMSGMAQPRLSIKAPGNGTVAMNGAVEGEFVTAGTELATAYDFSKIYVTARVNETDVAAVHPGASVRVDVDAFPGAPVSGVVEEVQSSAAGVFSPFPQSNSSGDFQKVTQVIPIKIALTNTAGQRLVPGMSVTVHIDKR